MVSKKFNSTTSENEVYGILREACSERLNELGKLVALHKSAKTKTKKNYLQKKIDMKRNRVLQYMLEIEKIESNISGETDDN